MKNALILTAFGALCVLIVACLIGAASNFWWLVPAGVLFAIYIGIVFFDVTKWRPH